LHDTHTSTLHVFTGTQPRRRTCGRQT
jgi:hypothetical protein